MAIISWTFVQAIAGPLGPTFTGNDDSTLIAALPNTNVGSANTMRADSAGSGLNIWIAFDLFGAIPAEATVLDARLEFIVVSVGSNNAGTVGVYRCLKNPTESQVTWNAVDSGLNWNTAGAKGESDTEVDNDDAAKADRRTNGFGNKSHNWLYGGGSGLQTVIPLSNSWFIGLVQDWVDGSVESSRGLILDAISHVTTPAADVTAHSSEATNPVNRPRLYVEYRIPSVMGVGKVNHWNRADGQNLGVN